MTTPSPKLPKGANRVWGTGRPLHRPEKRGSQRSLLHPPAPAAKGSKARAGDADHAAAAQPRTRPDITQKGREMIGEMRTEALVKALGKQDLGN